MITIKPGQTILFQGDSVTDAGRDKQDSTSLGNGYPALIAQIIANLRPEGNYRVLNRGISGNRVKDLEARWTQDCIDIQPDVLSILIGINDTWRRFDKDDPTDVEVFYQGYRRIAERARNETSAQLLLMEPFVLPVPQDRKLWREDLDPKIHAVRAVAKEYGATLLPLDGIMNAAGIAFSYEAFAADGVHPTRGGHELIAARWISSVKFA